MDSLSRGASVGPFDGRELPRVTFIYLGTAEAFGGFVLNLARSSEEFANCNVIAAEGRPLSSELARIGVPVLSVPAIKRLNPSLSLSNFLKARKLILTHLEERRPHLVVNLMPHVWSPLLTRSIIKRCETYATVIHDAVQHPGDPTGLVTPWLLCDGLLANHVVTLSESIKEKLIQRRVKPPGRILKLFHPDLRMGSCGTPRQFKQCRPLRLLFFGRILPYKGLPLLIEAVELLRREGMLVTLGVAGAGNITPFLDRLKALDARVVNRWISDDEASALLSSFDAIACSHVEASQSGVAALAFGHCMPVVATPISGLVEQVTPNQTGVLSANVTPRAFADAIRQLASVPGLYDLISLNIAETHQDRSMKRFASMLINAFVKHKLRDEKGV